MPSIAEATRASGDGSRRRLVVGMAFVLIGSLLVGVGAAGTVRGATIPTGLSVGGLAVVGCLTLLAARATRGRRERAVAFLGAMISGVSLVFPWAMGSVVGGLWSVLTAGVGFTIGLTVLLAAVLAGVTLDRGDRTGPSPSSPVAWTRSESDNPTSQPATDGGTAEDEYSVSKDRQ